MWHLNNQSFNSWGTQGMHRATMKSLHQHLSLAITIKVPQHSFPASLLLLLTHAPFGLTLYTFRSVTVVTVLSASLMLYVPLRPAGHIDD